MQVCVVVQRERPCLAQLSPQPGLSAGSGCFCLSVAAMCTYLMVTLHQRIAAERSCRDKSNFVVNCCYFCTCRKANPASQSANHTQIKFTQHTLRTTERRFFSHQTHFFDLSAAAAVLEESAVLSFAPATLPVSKSHNSTTAQAAARQPQQCLAVSNASKNSSATANGSSS